MTLPNHIIERILWRAWQYDNAATIAADVQMPLDVVIAVLKRARRRLSDAIPKEQRYSTHQRREKAVSAAIELRRRNPRMSIKQIAHRLGLPLGSLTVYLWQSDVKLSEIEGRGCTDMQSRADKSESVRTRPVDTGPNGQRSANSETTPTAGGGRGFSPSRSAQSFTDEEQAAIEAAMQSGKVTRIEQGEWPEEGRPELNTNFFSFVKARKNGTERARYRA